MIASSVRAQRAHASNAAHRTVQRIARGAVPTHADFCLVYLVAGRAIRAIAAVHATREGSRDVRALMKAYRISTDDRGSTVAQVIRTHHPLLRTGIHADPGMTRKAGSVADLHLRLAAISALVVPIIHDGAVLGAVSLCYSSSGRSYNSRNVPWAERLAGRIAHVLRPAGEAGGTRAPERPGRDGQPGQRRAIKRR